MSDTVKLVTDLKTYTGTLSGNTDQVLVVHNNNETVRVPFDQFKNSQTIPSVPTSPTSDGTEGDISVTVDAVYTYTNGEWGKSPRNLDWGATYLRIDQGSPPLTSDQLIVLQSNLPKATEEGPGIVALANDVTEKYPEGYAATPEYVNARVKELEDLKRGPEGPPGPKGDDGIFLEEFTYYTTVKGDSDINFRWAQLGAIHTPKAGTIVEVRIPCRSTASDAVTTDPVYLSLFEETDVDGVFAYRGTSTNAVIQRAGNVGVWEFDNIVLGGGKLRVGPSLTADSVTLADNLVLAGRGILNDSDSCYVRNIEGRDNNYALQVVFKYVTVKTAQCEQGAIHLTEEEYANLTRLLSKADQLLALVQ